MKRNTEINTIVSIRRNRERRSFRATMRFPSPRSVVAVTTDSLPRGNGPGIWRVWIPDLDDSSGKAMMVSSEINGHIHVTRRRGERATTTVRLTSPRKIRWESGT